MEFKADKYFNESTMIVSAVNGEPVEYCTVFLEELDLVPQDRDHVYVPVSRMEHYQEFKKALVQKEIEKGTTGLIDYVLVKLKPDWREKL